MNKHLRPEPVQTILCTRKRTRTPRARLHSMARMRLRVHNPRHAQPAPLGFQLHHVLVCAPGPWIVYGATTCRHARGVDVDNPRPPCVIVSLSRLTPRVWPYACRRARRETSALTRRAVARVLGVPVPMCDACRDSSRQVAVRYRPGLVVIDATRDGPAPAAGQSAGGRA